MLGVLNIIPQGWVTPVLMIATNVPLYTLTPRFVMDVRELYVLETEGCLDRDIDTGFGFSSETGHATGSMMLGTMVFVVPGRTEVLDDANETVMVEERDEGRIVEQVV